MDERRVTLSFSEQELRDINRALAYRMDAIADARPNIRCVMQRGSDAAAARVSELGIKIDGALKRLAKMPGGDR